MSPGPGAVRWQESGEHVSFRGAEAQTPCSAIVSFINFYFSSSLAYEH